MKYVACIGLEIHAELKTDTKLFCGCENSFGGEPNTRICAVCSGFPGAIGVLNKNALFLAVSSGLALDCRINNYSAFDRKNYFYPDLPKGYQITQQRYPICQDGFVQINDRKIRINNIHLEEDAGKLIHGKDITLIDFNRCGVPLIEIVTEPDITSADEAVSFVEEICLRLKYAGVCDGKMEQGSLRVDVNVSVAPENSEVPGTRCEIKNLSSFKSVKKAIEYEITRQTEVLFSGDKIVFETRRFDENSGRTYSMRVKEDIVDYRYFPEPDITPVYVTDEEIEMLRDALPERPDKRFKRYVNEYKLTSEEAGIIVSNPELSEYYDSLCSGCNSFKKLANLLLVGLGRLFNERGGNVKELPFEPEDIMCIANMWQDGKINSSCAMELLEMLYSGNKNPYKLAVDNNMIITYDADKAEEEIIKILSLNQEAVCDYKSGNKRAFGFLMGQAVKALGKSTDTAALKELLEKKLND